MKKLTCKELGGPCDAEITGNSFAEIGQKCREHVMDQINNGDAAHIAAAAKMRNASPDEQKSLMVEFEKRFDEAPSLYLSANRLQCVRISAAAEAAERGWKSPLAAVSAHLLCSNEGCGRRQALVMLVDEPASAAQGHGGAPRAKKLRLR